jgi:PST family polysaccharide transporter
VKILGRLGKNILGLGGLQIANFLTTLVMIPYLTRVFGVEGWGEIVFALLLINYLVWFSNWGFYLGAVQKIAACRNLRDQVSAIACQVWCAQLLLTAISILFLLFYSFYFSKLSLTPLFIAGITLLIGNLMTPLWILNGLERVWEASLIQFLAKLLAVPFILILVHAQTDAATYIYINGIASISIGLCYLFWLVKSRQILLTKVCIKGVYERILMEKRLFVTSITGSMTEAVIPTFLGWSGNIEALGLFNIADRIKSAGITVLHPVVHALYPRMSHLFSANKKQAIELLKTSGLMLLFASGLISLVIWLFSSNLVVLLAGNEFHGASAYLNWLAAIPFVSTISSFIIYQILVPAGEERYFLYWSMIVLILNLLLIYPLVQLLGGVGAAITSSMSALVALGVLFLMLRLTWGTHFPKEAQ